MQTVERQSCTEVTQLGWSAKIYHENASCSFTFLTPVTFTLGQGQQVWLSAAYMCKLWRILFTFTCASVEVLECEAWQVLIIIQDWRFFMWTGRSSKFFHTEIVSMIYIFFFKQLFFFLGGGVFVTSLSPPLSLYSWPHRKPVIHILIEVQKTVEGKQKSAVGTIRISHHWRTAITLI